MTLRFRLRSLSLFPAVAVAATALSAASAPNITGGGPIGPVVFWHTLDGASARFLDGVIQEFTAETGIDVRVETGMELAQSLIESFDDGTSPDVVLAPSDTVDLAHLINLSQVPSDLAGTDRLEPRLLRTLQIKEVPFGAPIFDGNILLLYFNQRLMPMPAATLDDHADVAWFYENPYVFSSFFMTFGGFDFSAGKPVFAGRAKAEAALLAYGRLHGTERSDHCDYTCVTSDFYAGRRAQVINGDWAWREAEVALGKDLGIAPLPIVGVRRLTSLRAPHALIFPAQSLSGPRAAHLRSLTQFLQSPAIQARWFSAVRRIPIDPTARAAAQAQGGPAAVILAELARAEPMPPMTRVWPGLDKGLRLFLHGVMNAREALTFMQSLASGSEGPK